MGSDYRRDTAYTIDEYSQLRSIIESSEDRIPICFCIDISDSMSILTNHPGDFIPTNRTYVRDGISQREVEMKPGKKPHYRIDELRRVLQDMLHRMNSISSLRKSAIIYIITFSRYADTPIGPSECDSINSRDIQSIDIGSDDTFAARGINLALEKLDFLSKAIKDASALSYRPVLIFMSDGTPTDGREAEQVGAELHKRSINNELTVIPIAIGEDLDLAWMKGMTSNGRVYQMKFDNEFDEVFNLITKRIVQTAIALPIDAMIMEKDNNMSNSEENDIDQEESTKYGRSSSVDDMQAFLNEFGL